MIWDDSNFYRRYAPLLVLATLFGGLFGYIHSTLKTPLYRSSALLQLPPGHRQGRKILKVTTEEPRPEFVSELLVLKSDRLARRVIGELDLASRADFLGFTPSADSSPEAHEALVQDALLLLRQNFIVSIVNNTDLARLAYTSSDPRLATAIVNRFMDDFLEDRFERRLAGAGRGEQLLAGRLGALRDEFTASQRRLLALQEELQSPGFSPRSNQIAAQLERLAAAERSARLRRLADADRAGLIASAAARARRDGAPEELVPPSMPFSGSGATETAVQDDAAITQENLRGKLLQARVMQAQASSLLGPNHPTSQAAAALVTSYEQQIAGENALILTAAERRAEVDAGEQAGLKADFLEHVAQARELEPVIEEYTVLERKYVFARVLYYRFETRLRVATLDAGLSQSAVYIVDRAEPAVWPLNKDHGRETRAAALLSLVLAWMLAMVLRYRSNLLVRVEHVEGVTGLPALAALPQLAGFKLNDYVDLLKWNRRADHESAATALFVDGIFDLACAVPAERPGGRAPCVLVTSSSPGEGKTTVNAALAMTLAHGGRRVLLIDADLHRPMVGARLALTKRVGLSSVLGGYQSLDEAVQAVSGVANLDVLTSGPVPPNADRMLASGAMRDLLEEARERYAVVVIDAPPVLAVQDALVLTQLADHVIWVMRDLTAKAWLTRRTRKLLEEVGAPVLGLVINGTALPRTLVFRTRSRGRTETATAG